MKRAMSFAVTFILCIQLLVGFASADETKVLRVGVNGYDGFIELNENGEYEGYCVEYLEKIVSYTGHELRYIPCDWSESLQMLLDHELDIVCTASFTPERNEIYDYSAQNFGNVQVVLYTTPDNNELYYEDFEHFDGKRIGVMNGATNIYQLEEYARRHKFEYTQVLVDSEEELIASLENGDVDMICTENLAYHEEIKLVSTFSNQPYFIMSYKDNDFMDEIDSAMERITSYDHNYVTKLYDKYYRNEEIDKHVHFTREETELLDAILDRREAHGGERSIRIALNSNRAPLSYVDKNGQVAGIYAGILKRLADISHVDITLVPLEPQNAADAYNFYRENDIDFFLVKDNETTYKESKDPSSGIRVTDPFFESNKVVIARRDLEMSSINHYRIAYITNSETLSETASKWFPNSELVACQSADECFEKLIRKEADIMVYDRYLAESQLLRPIYEELLIIPGLFKAEGMSLSPVVLKNGSYEQLGEAAFDEYLSNEILINAVNKIVQSISNQDIDEIVMDNTISSSLNSLSTRDFLYKYRHLLIASLGCLIVAIAAFVIIYSYERQNNKNQQARNLQLADALRHATHASQAKGEFLSNMSHEIRTPMNAIVGLTYIAQDHVNEPHKIRECLSKIETSSKVLLEIINNVLDMSAIEGEKLQLAHENLNMNSIVQEIESLYAEQCKERGIAFITKCDVKHAALIGDEVRLKQIILNFVSNSMKFTPDGGTIKFYVRETSKREDKVFLRFFISDTGCGMSEEMKGRLFMPFEQENASTVKKYGGSGLGLSIAKNLIDMMHGAVSVDTKQGEGTVFTIDIPFDLADEEEHSTIIEDEAFDFTGTRVLLCEDNEINREIARAVLETVNFTVDEAKNGEEGLEMFKAAPAGTYDIILMDVQMPVMDGREATRAIRALGREDSKKIPIIAMTAFAFSDDVSEVLSVGMNAHISKPIDPKLLYAVMKKYLGI